MKVIIFLNYGEVKAEMGLVGWRGAECLSVKTLEERGTENKTKTKEKKDGEQKGAHPLNSPCLPPAITTIGGYSGLAFTSRLRRGERSVDVCEKVTKLLCLCLFEGLDQGRSYD